MSHRKVCTLALAVAAATAALIAPTPASAGLLVQSAPDCEAQSMSRVFMPWLDLADYYLAPDGGLENGGAGWTLAGGAAVVDGNESYDLSGEGSKSLLLSDGSSATTPTTCVGLGEPAMRFVVRKESGGLLASLRVEALVEDELGLIETIPMGATGGLSSWQPSPQMLVVANLLPLLPDEKTPVAFRFVPQGGTWQIDDVYVDPARKP